MGTLSFAGVASARGLCRVFVQSEGTTVNPLSGGSCFYQKRAVISYSRADAFNRALSNLGADTAVGPFTVVDDLPSGIGSASAAGPDWRTDFTLPNGEAKDVRQRLFQRPRIGILDRGRAFPHNPPPLGFADRLDLAHIEAGLDDPPRHRFGPCDGWRPAAMPWPP